jgi:hypothetical protein
MALASPLPTGSITQRFGPSTQAIQPSMYHEGTHRAWWQFISGWSFNANCHAGVDFAGGVAGTPLYAAEAGTVTKSWYDGVNGGGHVVEVEIRSGVRYSYNHCSTRYVGVGAKVGRGARIAGIGATGTILLADGSKVRSAYGVHCHAVLTMRDSAGRWILYDFADFMAGGSHAGDARVKPLTTTVNVPDKLVRLNPWCNVRSTPDLDVGATNIAYTTRDTGVYNLKGQKVANLGGWTLKQYVSNDDGKWGQLYGLGRTVYMMEGLFR